MMSILALSGNKLLKVVINHLNLRISPTYFTWQNHDCFHIGLFLFSVLSSVFSSVVLTGKLSPSVCLRGFKSCQGFAVSDATQVSCAWRLVLYALALTVWAHKCPDWLPQSSTRTVQYALLVWSIWCASLAFWTLTSVPAQAAWGCAHACLCFGVPRCADPDKNLLIYLSVPLSNSAFWIAEGVDSSLSHCFSVGKIASLLEITSHCGLKCFLGLTLIIIIHYVFGLDNCFQRFFFFNMGMILHGFLSSWCIVGECCS